MSKPMVPPEKYREDPIKGALLAAAIGTGGTAAYDSLSGMPHSNMDIAKRALLGGALSGLIRYGSMRYVDPALAVSARLKPNNRSMIMNKAASSTQKMHKLFFKSAISYSPELGAVGGGLGGAAIGGLGNAMFGNKKRSLLSRILAGGAIGGGLGAGAGYFTGTSSPDAIPSARSESSAPSGQSEPSAVPDEQGTPLALDSKGYSKPGPSSFPMKYLTVEEMKHDALTKEVEALVKGNKRVPAYNSGFDRTDSSPAAVFNKNRDADTLGLLAHLKKYKGTPTPEETDARDTASAAQASKGSRFLLPFPDFNQPKENDPPKRPPVLSRFDPKNQGGHKDYRDFNIKNPFNEGFGVMNSPTGGGGSGKMPPISSIGSTNTPEDFAAMRRAISQGR